MARSRTTGPLRALAGRVKAKRAANVSTVAVARKLVVIAWHRLNRGEDYAFAWPSLVREKLRRAELLSRAQRRKGHRAAVGVFATSAQNRLEQELVAQAENRYQRLVRDWQPQIKQGAGVTPGRAPSKPSKGKAARQTP